MIGQRDRLLRMLMFNTGARVFESIGVRIADTVRGPTNSIQLHCKACSLLQSGVDTCEIAL